MIIKQKWIRSFELHFAHLHPSEKFILGLPRSATSAAGVRRAGFDDAANNGDSVLPPVVGPITRFNAEGKYEVHRDRKKETAYRQVEWHWTEYHGKDGRVEQWDIRDVPYERYPRTLIPPPGVTLTLATSPSGDEVIVGPLLTNLPARRAEILHAANVLLELFGECHLYDEKLGHKLIKAPIQRLNWEILPPGKYPWAQIRGQVAQHLTRLREGTRKVVMYRLELLTQAEPEFVAIGRGGFSGYFVFGFPKRSVYILESVHPENATYVFEEDWEDLSKLTKAEILAGNLQRDRLIHRVGWKERLLQTIR